jgi:hypothetical protein
VNLHVAWGRAAQAGRGAGLAAVASFLAAVLTEIYRCNVCSCQEVLIRRAPVGRRRPVDAAEVLTLNRDRRYGESLTLRAKLKAHQFLLVPDARSEYRTEVCRYEGWVVEDGDSRQLWRCKDQDGDDIITTSRYFWRVRQRPLACARPTRAVLLSGMPPCTALLLRRGLSAHQKIRCTRGRRRPLRPFWRTF